MSGPSEPEDQLTAERCPPPAVPARSRARGPLVTCAILVVAASGVFAWWLGIAAGVGIYGTGTLALAAAVFGLGRRSGRR